MRRNIRNELLVALIVSFVGLIVLGAIIATSTVVDIVPPTEVAESMTDSATNTDSPVDETPEITIASVQPEAEVTPSVEPPQPSATESLSDTPEATATEEPTLTLSPTATDIPPTATFTALPSTNTEIPLSTGTPILQITPVSRFPFRITPAPITPENDVLDLSNRLTLTAIVATSDIIMTEFLLNQPTLTSTEPSVVAAAPTLTLTSVPEQSSSTPVADSLGILPTPPATPTVISADATNRPESTCELPAGWTTYTVESGNTLFAIALAVNETLEELRYANCLDDVDDITTGDVLFVPRAPVNPVSTTSPADVRLGLRSIGCSDPAVQITSPVPLQRVSGVFEVLGSATWEDFNFYKIEIRPDWADIYNFFLESSDPIMNASLGSINTGLFDGGVHWILLTVVDERWGVPENATCAIPVIFE